MLKPSLETHNVDGVLVAEFWECLRLDPAPVQTLRTQYETHTNGRGRPDVVVDLSGVGFAGSAALGIFVALQRTVRSRGGRIIFCNVDPTVAEVFRASNLHSLFEFAADRAGAVRAIVEGAPAGPGLRKDGALDAAQTDKTQRPGRSGGGPLRRRHHEPGSA